MFIVSMHQQIMTCVLFTCSIECLFVLNSVSLLTELPGTSPRYCLVDVVIFQNNSICFFL